jgi:hypothetical protein
MCEYVHILRIFAEAHPALYLYSRMGIIREQHIHSLTKRYIYTGNATAAAV